MTYDRHKLMVYLIYTAINHPDQTVLVRHVHVLHTHYIHHASSILIILHTIQTAGMQVQ